MTRFLYWSDLHTEFRAFPLPDVTGIDAVLLGGDTGVGNQHLDFLFQAWKTYQVPVISLYGNHEFYQTVMEDQIAKDNERLAKWHAAGIPIHVLNPGQIVIKGVRILGGTLWTDMRMMGDDGVFTIPKVERALNDYNLIRTRDPVSLQEAQDTVGTFSRSRPLRASDTIAMHMHDRDCLFGELAKPFDGPTLVMTHHIPTAQCVHPMYRNDPITAGFASELTPQIQASKADYWMYGHTHKKTDVDIQRLDGGITRMRSNIRGYPHEYDPHQFSPTFTLEL